MFQSFFSENQTYHWIWLKFIYFHTTPHTSLLNFLSTQTPTPGRMMMFFWDVFIIFLLYGSFTITIIILRLKCEKNLSCKTAEKKHFFWFSKRILFWENFFQFFFRLSLNFISIQSTHMCVFGFLFFFSDSLHPNKQKKNKTKNRNFFFFFSIEILWW